MLTLSQYPKISIVTPSYNQGEFLEETILSVVSQNYPNLEYIVIDGGSTDDSVEIIKKYEKYITYWVSEKDNGHAHALNKGFEKCTGEIMAWINSDDKYFEWTFKTIAKIYCEFPEIEWTVGLYSNFDREGVLMSGGFNVRSTYKNVLSYLIGDLHIQQESVFWRRSLWNRVGAYVSTDVHLMVDTELWCRFFQFAELYHIDQVIGGYRTYGLNRSHNNNEKVILDINYSINKLKEGIDFKVKNKYKELIEFSEYFKKYNYELDLKNKKLDKNIFLNLLPMFIYWRVRNLIFKMSFKLKNPIIPDLEEYSIKVIKKDINCNNKLELIPFTFTY
jgi:glycosyltransferase involved in cell wall biosynthesis